MKGLLYKDNQTVMKAYRNNALLVMVIYTMLSLTMEMPFFMYALIFLFGMYAMSTISFDEASHWDTYARTLPVTTGQIVGVKYLLTLFWSAVGAAACMVLLTISSCVKGGGTDDFLMNLAGTFAVLAVVLLYNAVTGPLSYKFSATKSRSYVMMAMGLLIFGGFMLISYAKDHGIVAPTFFSNLENTDGAQLLIFLCVLMVVMLALYAASWALSVKIYNDKEF